MNLAARMPRHSWIYRKYKLSYTKKSQSEDWDFYKSDRRGSNQRPRPWQGRTLPTEPLSHSLYCSVCFLCSLEQYILYRIIRLLSTAFFNFFQNFWCNIFYSIFLHTSHIWKSLIFFLLIRLILENQLFFIFFTVMINKTMIQECLGILAARWESSPSWYI